MRNYVVKTRFGEINVAWSNIAEARRDARRRFGVGPECVTPARDYNHCDDCDSAPCCCTVVAS